MTGRTMSSSAQSVRGDSSLLSTILSVSLKTAVPHQETARLASKVSAYHAELATGLVL